MKLVIFKKFGIILTKLPFYPHWLEIYKQDQGNKQMVALLKGDVIEVGAGEGSKKDQILRKNKRIKKYLSTDYSSWDNEFRVLDIKAKKFGGFLSGLLRIENRYLDNVCNALDLPYSNNSFDCHLSFEVLEHIENPYQYFKEAARVVKPRGLILFSVPFLYRMHGGEPDHKLDYFRFGFGFFRDVAKENKLSILSMYSNTGIGTTCAAAFSQWVIQRFNDANILTKIIMLFFLPELFFTSNIIGFLLDLIPDKRFAIRFHIVMRKLK